jgi:hypothetical protein
MDTTEDFGRSRVSNKKECNKRLKKKKEPKKN